MGECRHTDAIVLAAGKGTRMESDIQKQYLELGGKPLIYYALKAFEDSPVDQIILVTGQGETGYCRKEIVERFGFQKVRKITEGGREQMCIRDRCNTMKLEGGILCISTSILQNAFLSCGHKKAYPRGT